MKSAFKKMVIIGGLLLALLSGALRPSYAIFDKTRFAFDVGVAYFAFHHWVYNPYRAGSLSKGAPHRTSSIIKGGVALLFAVNRLKAANKILQTTKSPTLIMLRTPINALYSSFASVGQRMKSGHFSKDDVDTLNNQVGTVNSGASTAGIKIKDVPLAIPGT